MAKAGRFGLRLNYSEVERNLNVVISKVGRGTRKATVQACEDIKRLSLPQVPVETGSLVSTFYYDVRGSSKTGFYAELGYGGPKDRMNPKGKLVSEYMVAVHEDLSAKHKVGKAKFLEDPVREYAARFGPRFAHVIKQETGM